MLYLRFSRFLQIKLPAGKQTYVAISIEAVVFEALVTAAAAFAVDLNLPNAVDELNRRDSGPVVPGRPEHQN